MSARPCEVRLPGGTSHSGQGSAEYALRRALSQVGERTPCRLTITTYFNSGRPAAIAGQTASRSAAMNTASGLFLTIRVVPETAGVGRLVPFALVDENGAAS